MKSDHLLLEEIHAAASVVKAFSSSDASRSICALLDAVIESYKSELMQVKPDGLIRLQSIVQQAQAIRNVVADDSPDIPRL